MVYANARLAATDGWVGPPDLPGYRAGNVVARLADLPSVYPDHLYFHLLLLDAAGELQDDHSGPCYALSRDQPLQERSRFVRVVAELVRHCPTLTGDLSPLGQTLSVIRQQGIDPDHLVLAARLLDEASTEQAVVLSLKQLLQLSLGDDEAHDVMCEVVSGLARRRAPPVADPAQRAEAHLAVDSMAGRINDAGLEAQLAYVVHTVGKSHARRYLREAVDFTLVPSPELFGV